MKSNVVFYIAEGTVKFLQMTSQKVAGVDVISIADQNDEQASQTLNAFIKSKKLNFSDTRVTVLIPRSRAILRFMVFPSHKDEEIRAMIDLQVGNRIPYVREEVELDYQILSKTTDGYTKVAVVVIPQDLAMRYWKIFADARIPVHSLTISSVGLWLLYQHQADFSEKPGAIFDMDVNHTEICLCYKDHWLTSREIPVGFVQMQQSGYADIINQWELTQNNSSGEKLSTPVDSVYLVSSANRAYALAIEMEKINSDMKIKEVLLPQNLGLAKGVEWPKVITDDGTSIAALAGIALSSGKPPIDLVPGSVKKSQEQNIFRRQLVSAGIWVATALVSLGLALGMGLFKKNMQLSQLEKQVYQTKKEATTVESQLNKIKGIEGVMTGRLVFSDLAGQLYRLLPSQVYLVNIVVSEGNVLSLQGVATNSIDINQFQKGMVDSHRFANVSLDYVNKRVTPNGEVDYFKITCTLNAVSGVK